MLTLTLFNLLGFWKQEHHTDWYIRWYSTLTWTMASVTNPDTPQKKETKNTKVWCGGWSDPFTRQEVGLTNQIQISPLVSIWWVQYITGKWNKYCLVEFNFTIQIKIKTQHWQSWPDIKMRPIINIVHLKATVPRLIINTQDLITLKWYINRKPVTHNMILGH